mgnify:FL=1
MNNLMKQVAMMTAAFLVLLSFTLEASETQMNWQPPAFEAQDADGSTVRFPQDLDGPAIVLFWAGWCPYCKALMPHLQSIVDEYGDDIEILALNFRDDEDPVAFIDERGFDFHLITEAGPVAELWGVKAIPALFLVDRSGQAVFSNYAIPEEAYPTDAKEQAGDLKHYQKAARRAPFWAAQLRRAIDGIQE